MPYTYIGSDGIQRSIYTNGNGIIEANINLSMYPTRCVNADRIKQLTLGDLHSNPITLIYTLVYGGFCNLLSPIAYRRLVGIYHTELTLNNAKALLCEFEELVTTNLIHFNTTKLLRLIGDIIADRGSCDEYIFIILYVLEQNKVNYNILLSNHDSDFIFAYEAYKKRRANRLTGGMVIHPTLVPSLTKLDQLAHSNVLSYANIIARVEYCYIPHLRLLDYSYSEDKDELTIFSHAPIDWEMVSRLAVVFGIRVKQNPTSVDKMTTINAINQDYLLWLNQGYFTALYDTSLIIDNGENMDKKSAIEWTMWNRDETLNPDAFSQKDRYIYGHTGNRSDEKMRSIDNVFGKGFQATQSINTAEHYKIFVSDDDVTAPTLNFSKTNLKVNLFTKPYIKAMMLKLSAWKIKSTVLSIKGRLQNEILTTYPRNSTEWVQVHHLLVLLAELASATTTSNQRDLSCLTTNTDYNPAHISDKINAIVTASRNLPDVKDITERAFLDVILSKRYEITIDDILLPHTELINRLIAQDIIHPLSLLTINRVKRTPLTPPVLTNICSDLRVNKNKPFDLAQTDQSDPIVQTIVHDLTEKGVTFINDITPADIITFRTWFSDALKNTNSTGIKQMDQELTTIVQLMIEEANSPADTMQAITDMMKRISMDRLKEPFNSFWSESRLIGPGRSDQARDLYTACARGLTLNSVSDLEHFKTTYGSNPTWIKRP